MLLVDDRGGSEGAKKIITTLVDPLIKAGIPAVLQRIESADIAFIGRGSGGSPVHVGIELKRLDAGSTDLTQSLMSGRLSGEQLPKMVGPKGAYDYGWLVVEGNWRSNDAGQITTFQGPKRGWVPARGGITAVELEKRLLTLELCGGLRVHRVNSRRDTVRFIGSLYRWFTDRDMDEHTSHLTVHEPPSFLHVSDFRKAVCKWPGIGLKVSKSVEQRFTGSVRDAVNASVNDWASIETDGRKFGTARASKLFNFLNGKK